MDIIIDFDGSCVTHEFPKVGKDIGAQRVLQRIIECGNNLILFTMRSDRQTGVAKKGSLGYDNLEQIVLQTNVLEDAVNWFKEKNIPLYGIQTNPTQHNWTNSPKAYGQLIIDDAALGCPLKYDESISNRPFVDWDEVEIILEEMGVIF